MKEPVDHILRPSLPWRSATDSPITECGYDAAKVNTITRSFYALRYKELGRQRAAMMTCMTCAQTAERWATWDDDPRKAIGREVEWETAFCRSKRGDRLKDELLAIAQLIEKHGDEFSQIIADSNARREWLERKKAEKSKEIKTRTRSL